MGRLLVKGSAYCQPLNRLNYRLNSEVSQQERLLNITVQRDQQVGDSSLLNTSCGFNRASYKGSFKLCIHFYPNELIECHPIQVVSLSKQHAINNLLNLHHFKQFPPHWMATSCFAIKQNQKIQSPIVDINHWLNKILLAFNSLNKELFPGF